MCILGNSRMANLMLMKLAVQCLLPKKYGGLRASKVFVLDAGNCTDVYQFIDFMKQYGLNIKKNLKRIMISRVFTVYQLTHYLKYELTKIINDYRINIVIIPDLLTMFFQEAEIDFEEVRYLVAEIIDVLKLITREGKVLLLTSLAVDEQSHPLAVLKNCE
jgi:archaellum biogenesis ATPase FlaH